MHRKIPFLSLFLVLLTGGCFASESGDHAAVIQVRDAYVRGLPPTQKNTAAFLRLINDSDKPVTLFAGTTEVAESLEIHKHLHHDGMMRMERQESVVVAPRAELAFVPGGYHLMLLNLRQPLQDGDRVTFSLKTSTGEELKVTAPVISVLRKPGD